MAMYIILKIVRKFRNTFEKCSIKCKLYSYRVLSRNRIVFQSPWYIGKNFTIYSDLTNTIINVSSGIRIRDNFNVTIGKKGKLMIGNNCFFNNNCSINCLGDIEIGNDNQFGESVLFYDHNHTYTDKNKLISEQGYNIGSIKIGSNCWIGSQVVILKDVVIGDNVVIGAGCVIYKSIASNTRVVNQQNLVEKPI
jgi:acetyltransferase-like isoleucine patch superfamily enzyme